MGEDRGGGDCLISCLPPLTLALSHRGRGDLKNKPAFECHSFFYPFCSQSKCCLSWKDLFFLCLFQYMLRIVTELFGNRLECCSYRHLCRGLKSAAADAEGASAAAGVMGMPTRTPPAGPPRGHTRQTSPVNFPRPASCPRGARARGGHELPPTSALAE